MTIPSSFIDRILDQSDIVDIIGKRVQLTKKGSNFVGLCPFHDDHNPSMTVNQERQFFYCFVCGAKGNSINFLRDHDNLDFVDAVETIASSIGLEVPHEKINKVEKNSLDINMRASLIFQGQLRDKEGEKAIGYLKDRAISGKVAKFFEIGYAKNSWTGLYDELSKDFNNQMLIDSGLFSDTKKDRFRNRIIFPIRNIKGENIGFGGRIIDEGEPKYLNSPETTTFSKSKELYGLYETRLSNKKIDDIFVVEGYMDVIALFQNGVSNAVATLGTAITAQHISKLIRYSQKLFITFDGDLAGKKAAWRAVENSLPALREDVQIMFIFLDENEDPDSFINSRGKDSFLKLKDQAISFSDYFLNTIKKKFQLDSIEGRSQAAKFSLPLIKKINNNTIKEAYISTLSDICNIDFNKLIRNETFSLNKASTNREDKKKPQTNKSIIKKSVLGVFTALIQHPKLASNHLLREIKNEPSFNFLVEIKDKILSNHNVNLSAVFESINEEKIRNLFGEAMVSEIALTEEDALNLMEDCLTAILRSFKKDREEILKGKYNIDDLNSDEKRELQKILLKKEVMSENDKALIQKLSQKI